AADDGIMPQTIEHFEIIRLLGIKEVLFIITKCDLVENSRVDAVAREILSLVEGTALQGAMVLRVSAKSGEGLGELKESIAEKILSMQDRGTGQGGHDAEGSFRMPVDRSFTIKGFGTVATGTVACGRLNKGSALIVYPSAEVLKVRGLESMHIPAEQVSAGERAAVNISGLSRKELRRGNCLMAPELEPFLSMAPVIDCDFEFIQKKGITKKGSAAFRDRGLIKVHHHTGETLARIRFVDRKKVLPGEAARGRLYLRRPLLMMRGDAFILRDPSVNTTVGGGRVIFSYARKNLVPGFGHITLSHARGEARRLAEELEMLTGTERPGFDMKSLALLLNVSHDRVEAFIRKRLDIREGGFYLAEGFLISKKRAHEAMQAMKELLARYHEKNPLDDGLTEEDLAGLFITSQKERKGAEGLRPLYRLIASEMVSAGFALREHKKLRLKGFNPALSDTERNIAAAVKKLLYSKGLGLTKKDEIISLGYPAKELEGVITYMKKQGDIISLRKDHYIDAAVLSSARARIERYIFDKGGINAGQCRDILGCGRKLAIEILEYLDNVGFTLRKADLRTLR
ncbi:MAG: SelB C-terminal domain-containing protein, partial [Thermodesulfobacteriota bacterium]